MQFKLTMSAKKLSNYRDLTLLRTRQNGRETPVGYFLVYITVSNCPHEQSRNLQNVVKLS